MSGTNATLRAVWAELRRVRARLATLEGAFSSPCSSSPSPSLATQCPEGSEAAAPQGSGQQTACQAAVAVGPGTTAASPSRATEGASDGEDEQGGVPLTAQSRSQSGTTRE